MDSSIKCKKTDRENFIRKNRYLVMFLTILILLMVNGFAQAKSIKICVIDDHSGDFALPNIPKTHGAQLAVEEINSSGGINGNRLELIHYDGQSNVKRYQELALKCVFDDEADVIMAGYTSSEREAARAVAVKIKQFFGTIIKVKEVLQINIRFLLVQFQNNKF